MLRTKWLVVAAACCSLSVGVALGASQSSETTPVTADFEASLVAQKQRTCHADQQEFRVRFEGSQTSSDPRLTGALEARVRSVINTSNGYGNASGRAVIAIRPRAGSSSMARSSGCWSRTAARKAS